MFSLTNTNGAQFMSFTQFSTNFGTSTAIPQVTSFAELSDTSMEFYDDEMDLEYICEEIQMDYEYIYEEVHWEAY